MAKKLEAKSKRSAGAVAAGQSGSRPPSVQVGALCWRRGSGGGLKVLLISSRDTKRWVIPKGWPMRRRTEAEAAAREAYEEAGVKGEIAKKSVGVFSYDKGLGQGRSIQIVVRVFPLKVGELLRKYPETGQRRIKWFGPGKAARKVREPELAALIRGFAEAQAAE